MIEITTHTLIKNEDQWVWYALSAWEPFAGEMLVYNDNSDDETEAVLESLKSPKIIIKKVAAKEKKDLTMFRNQMLEETKTEWFLLLDGDEIWNRKTIKVFLSYLEKLPKNVWAVVMETRNCVGDVFHYLPENTGRYELLGRTGHLTVRAYRKMPGFGWAGIYPLEDYHDSLGRSVYKQNNHLAFFDGFYWHLTHLRRSSSSKKVWGFRNQKYESGVEIKEDNELPEVFFEKRPLIVSDPLRKQNFGYELMAEIQRPFKEIKRKLLKF